MQIKEMTHSITLGKHCCLCCIASRSRAGSGLQRFAGFVGGFWQNVHPETHQQISVRHFFILGEDTAKCAQS